LEIEKAEAQSTQNAPIRTDTGIEVAGRGRVAARMGLIRVYTRKVGRLCSIWKLND